MFLMSTVALCEGGLLIQFLKNQILNHLPAQAGVQDDIITFFFIKKAPLNYWVLPFAVSNILNNFIYLFCSIL